MSSPLVQIAPRVLSEKLWGGGKLYMDSRWGSYPPLSVPLWSPATLAGRLRLFLRCSCLDCPLGLSQRRCAPASTEAGPCDPDTIEKETNCPLVWEIGVSGAEDFDCGYEEWTEHLRDAVHRAAEQPDVTTDPSTFEEDIAEKVKRALESGLEGGNRMERRDRGWVIVDKTDSYLADVERAVWVVGDDDEEMPPLYFDTAEAALLAVRSKY